MNFGRGKAPSFKVNTAAGPPKAHRAATRKRFTAMLRESAAILQHLPGPGEAVHAIMSGLYDFMSVIGLVITSREVPCTHLRIATLAFSERNLEEMTGLHDAGAVQRVSVLVSDFFAKHNGTLFTVARERLEERGGRLAAARSHCKIACLEFADGVKLVFEGSANLRSNRNWEQFALINSDELHVWHEVWLEEKFREWQSQLKL